MFDLASAVIIASLIFLLYSYIAQKYDFFEERNIPFIKPVFLLGNTAPVLLKRQDLLQNVKEMYNAFPSSKVVGLFDFIKPVLMIRDLDMLKQIGVKDFDHFSDHTPIFTRADVEDVGGDSLFGNSLFALRGQKWRDMRSTLSPAFTGSKMRHMFELVSQSAQSTVEFFRAEAKAGRTLEYEMKDVFSRFSNDVIASVAFGIEVDSFRERENSFYVKGKAMLNFQNVKTIVKMLLLRTIPNLMIRLKVDIQSKESTEYFKSMITDNMRQRDVHNIVRNDMIHMLMQVRKGALKHQKDEQETKDAGFATVEESNVGKVTHSRVWTDNELVSQCFLFFLAGFDTVSTALTFLSYELLVNPDIQQRLYEEILSVEETLNCKPLSYEVLQRMQYMDMVVSETLRKWPPAPFVDRFCVKDYQYDDGEGLRLQISKNQILWIPIVALHHDPKYYPNPEKFDPERFSEANRASINPAAYVPFGVGPRNCIGSRFALMEVKALVYNLVKSFTFERSAKTKVPLELVKSIVGVAIDGGMWLELKARS
ncbi:hypothetical protein quinque_007015 [Culex quinquefasciatus]|uniref:probable cytochrome P450 9f2 n=1 Tax=Culex quinquefasciatus TaxID=7176 RepID=UPI0018E3DFB7|nr:probable cytochrome P450 9f2 [Culex quinquefasciatus]